jgi:hypothetical protein
MSKILIQRYEKLKPNNKKVYVILFALVLCAQICFVIYKADYTGITYDESYTAQHFTKNIHQALTTYENQSNNHVLNSLFIAITDKFFNSYEHFIRIHSITFAILFSISTAYIIHKTIRSHILKAALLALIIFNRFVFDLSFLARGYSIALGGIYAGIALVLYLLCRKINYKNRWVPIAILVTMNFLALGSMLTSIFVLFGINAVFILLYSSSIFPNAPNRLKPMCLDLVLVSLGTFICLFLLYKSIYKDVLGARNYFLAARFLPYMKQLLVDNLSGRNSTFGLVVCIAFTVPAVLGAAVAIWQLRLKIKGKNIPIRPLINNPESFILLITAVTILAMFIHCTILKASLGYARNAVFLVPLVLISAGILIESLWKNLKSLRFINHIVRACTVIIIMLLIWQNIPSAYAVEIYNWKQQCISGPLLRRLKKINQNKEWIIGCTYETKNIRIPLQYYSSKGYYKFELSQIQQEFDIGVVHITEKPPGATLLDEKLFKRFDCLVVIFPKNFYAPGRQNPPQSLSSNEKR